MEARVKLFGHSIHQMLIAFPLGLLVTAIAFDAIHLATHGAMFALVSYWLIAAGILGGLAAAVFGFLDWLGIPRHTRAYRIGAWHGLGNAVLLLLYTASWVVRMTGDPASPSVLA